MFPTERKAGKLNCWREQEHDTTYIHLATSQDKYKLFEIINSEIEMFIFLNLFI